jgi:hypothetical protein
VLQAFLTELTCHVLKHVSHLSPAATKLNRARYNLIMITLLEVPFAAKAVNVNKAVNVPSYLHKVCHFTVPVICKPAR